MDEVLDLGVPVVFPPAADDELGALAHAESARQLAVAAMLSVPLRHEAQTVGVLTLRAQRRARPSTRPNCELAARARRHARPGVGAAARQRARPCRPRCVTAGAPALREVAARATPGVKLGAVLALALFVAVIALWQTDHRVSARTVVEGSTQLAAVAPFDGFVAEAPGARRRHRQAGPAAGAAGRPRPAARALALGRRARTAAAPLPGGAWRRPTAPRWACWRRRSNQAEAQLALAEEQLARADVVAPFDGVVVSGDLSQQIGSPVETGRAAVRGGAAARATA